MLEARARSQPRLQVRARGGWIDRALYRFAEYARVVLGPTEAATQRQDVIRRALVAAVIIGILPIQQLRIPGWQGVVYACVAALLYNIPLAHIVFVKQWFFLERVVGLLLDVVLLMVASLVVFHEMGASSSASDIWLVFVVYIVIGGFTLAPVGSLVYTALWIAWFALCTMLYFTSSSQYQEQLPMRLVFLGLIGLVSLGMAAELEKRRARLEIQNRQTMGMLATLVEARDTDAGAHLHRIQHFSKALALHVGFSKRDAEEIAYASMVHDVGKANVPDAILKKAGPLTPDERAVIQEHSVWGEQLLTENSDFEIARHVARWHHEKWDGTGYPDGLVGEQIPYPARIVAVADVFDALISQRPYKEAWAADAAIREIRRMAGVHLDSQLVDAFVELWRWGVIERITDEIADEPPHIQPLVSQAA